MTIRRFREGDAEAVSALIARTLRESNSRDYPAERIEQDVQGLNPEEIRRRAGWTHFYVAEENGQIVGCSAIGPYWGSETESSLFNIFVLPEYQGQGIGRAIIRTLEEDAFFLRARRVEIPASITGTPFYLKMGYTFKPGVPHPDEEGLNRLEKFR